MHYKGISGMYNIVYYVSYGGRYELQLDCLSVTLPRKINLPANQKGDDNSETTVGKLSARRIQICRVHFCLGIILTVILNNFQNKV